MNVAAEPEPAVRPQVLLPLAIVVGAAAFAFSCLFLPAQWATWGFGDEFARMAVDPFARLGAFPHRILGPLLAYGLGLGGERYWIFSHAMVVVFLACVFATVVQRRGSWLGAALVTGVISITGAVEVFKGYVGYTEPTSFALLLASVMLVRRPGWFWTVQFFGLLNHENLIFFWPWLLDRRATDGGGLRRADGVGALAALGAYLLARWAITSGRQVFSASFYLGDQKLPFIAGAWILAVLAVVVYFGVLPTMLAWQAWSEGWRRAGRGICLAIAAFFGMTFFANDVQRFVGFLAIPLTLAGAAMVRQPRGRAALLVLGTITAVAIVLQRDVVRLIFATMVEYPPDPVSALPTQIVPRLWYVFASYAATHVAMLLIGRWLGRR